MKSELKVVQLPESGLKDPVQIFDYNVSRESSKQQVNLMMNTFSFLLEGQKEVFSDTDSIGINPSKFLLMKAGKCLMTEKFAHPNAYYHSMLLFFSNEAILEFSRKYEIPLKIHADRKSVQEISYDPYIQSFVNGLIELKTIDESLRTRILKVRFEELMLYLTGTLGVEFLSSLMVDTDQHSSHFLEVVENNKLNKLTLSELAFLSNMSLSTFKREFEKHFQESPSKWFQGKRLEYSAFLLKNKAMRPSDIYQEIGYDSLTNFVQAFKSKFGTTPKQYQLD